MDCYNDEPECRRSVSIRRVAGSKDWHEGSCFIGPPCDIDIIAKSRNSRTLVHDMSYAAII